MTATEWQPALFTLIGLPILYLIGLVLFKSHQHGDRVRARGIKKPWDRLWVGKPPKALGRWTRDAVAEKHGKP